MNQNILAEVNEYLPSNQIIVAYRGSIAHNMYMPNNDPNSIDDIDLITIFMAPLEHYIGINKVKQSLSNFIGCYDIVSYEYMKIVNMLIASNPNVLSLLWLKPEHYINMHQYGKDLIGKRELFVSKRAFYSFAGYASGQLKKMTHFTFEGYMGEKRKALVEKIGYDAKNASHCIRLLRMCVEFLNDGELKVYRTDDVDELLRIKRGEYSLDFIKKEAENLFARAKKAYDESKLPEEPNVKEINTMVMDTMSNYICSGGRI